jgi:hypothetical protein
MRTEKPDTSFTSRFLQGAKDLIWQEDPAAKRAASSSAQASSQDAPAAARHETADSAMSKELLDAVMSRPTAYSAFADAIAALSDVQMDEPTRYRSAFAILRKTQQRSVEQIAQAVDVHLGALETEVTRFNGQSKSVEDEEIAARLKEADALRAAIEQTNAEISTLRADTEARIRALEEDIASKRMLAGELTREAEQKKQMIVQTEKDFALATETVRSRLSCEREKIRRLLA